MKILVTGATGFVGRHLVHALVRRGHDVIAVARCADRAREMPWFGDVNFVACDIHAEEPGALGHEHDLLIHLAWPGLPNYRELFHFEHNLVADYRFLSGMVGAGSRKLMVTGTCFEYGMQSGMLSENTPTAPTNPYGLAKDTLRRFLEALRERTPFILQWPRLFYMYGPGQNPNSLLAQLDQAIDRGDSSFDMSGGEQLRDYLPVEEVARRLALLAEHPECAGLVNCCSGRPISVRSLVETHVASRGADICLNFGRYPYPDYEPMAFWGNAAKLEACIGRIEP